MNDDNCDLYVLKKHPNFSEWFESIKDRGTLFRLANRIDRMKNNLGKFKRVGKDTFELIEDFGPGWRIYFTILGNQVVILTCGGSKDTQDKDIVKAIEIAQYLHTDA